MAKMNKELKEQITEQKEQELTIGVKTLAYYQEKIREKINLDFSLLNKQITEIDRDVYVYYIDSLVASQLKTVAKLDGMVISQASNKIKIWIPDNYKNVDDYNACRLLSGRSSFAEKIIRE